MANFIASMSAAAHELAAYLSARDLFLRTADVGDVLLAAGAGLGCEDYAGRAWRRVFMAGVWDAGVAAGWVASGAGVAAVDAGAAGDGRFEDCAATVAD